MEESVGVGDHTWRSQRHQRTDGRRLAFERELAEEAAIDVGVEVGIVLHQVLASGLDGDAGRGAGNREIDGKSDWDRGAYIYILHIGSKAGRGYHQVIGTERHVGDAELAHAS